CGMVISYPRPLRLSDSCATAVSAVRAATADTAVAHLGSDASPGTRFPLAENCRIEAVGGCGPRIQQPCGDCKRPSPSKIFRFFLAPAPRVAYDGPYAWQAARSRMRGKDAPHRHGDDRHFRHYPLCTRTAGRVVSRSYPGETSCWPADRPGTPSVVHSPQEGA